MNVLKKLVVAPVDMKMSVDGDFVAFFRKRVSKDTPIEKDDIIKLMLLGHEVVFKVVEVEPSIGTLQAETELQILPESIPEIVNKHKIDKLSYPREFIAKVISGGRITIPEAYRELHDIQEGDILMLGFHKIKEGTRV